MRLLIALMLLVAVEASAADVYMSTTGTKTTGKSTASDWSNANCYSTLAGAFAAMSGGDTLTINDGTYTGSNNAINNTIAPPSGTAGSPTIIMARNIPCDGVTVCSSALKVIFEATTTVQASSTNDTVAGAYFDSPGSRQYITFRGIKWTGPVVTGGLTYTIFKQCAFQGTASGNYAVVALGERQLLEDCVIMGKGRYGVLNYSDTPASRYNVVRRTIVRQDWANKDKDVSMPIAGIAVYRTNDIGILNSIVIDGPDPSNYWHQNPTYFIGGMGSTVADSTNISVLGNVVINYPGPTMHWTSGTVDIGTITDNVGINIGGGVTANNPMTINRLSLFNVNRMLWNWFDSVQQGIGKGMISTGLFSWAGAAAPSLTNSIISSVYAGTDSSEGYALNGVDRPVSYVNYYATKGRLNGSVPTNTITTNPVYSGSNTSGSIKYPVRVETGTSLKTGGSGGGQVGAEVMYKIGVDGTFYGETGWNVTQSDPLWPYPYEAWVKAELASMPSTITGSTMPSPTRGVASLTAKQLNGTSDVTLTSYIWESLGNQMPTNLYDGSSPPVTPTTAYGPRIQASGRFHLR